MPRMHCTCTSPAAAAAARAAAGRRQQRGRRQAAGCGRWCWCCVSVGGQAGMQPLARLGKQCWAAVDSPRRQHAAGGSTGGGGPRGGGTLHMLHHAPSPAAHCGCHGPLGGRCCLQHCSLAAPTETRHYARWRQRPVTSGTVSGPAWESLTASQALPAPFIECLVLAWTVGASRSRVDARLAGVQREPLLPAAPGASDATHGLCSHSSR